MKKISFFILFVITVLGAQAQNRLNIAGFSQFKQYFNPALTGYNGTAVQGFYRNQMTTFDKAPQTFFLSGEARLPGKTGKLQHSIGLAAMRDAFGDTKDIGLNLSYSAAAKISAGLNLRGGLAVTYNNVKTNPANLIPLDPSDPAYQALKNSSVLNKYGVNAGVALTSENFYAGYAAIDAVKSGSGNTAYYNDVYVLQHSLQAGYRYAVSSAFGLVANGLYRYDANRKGVAEGNIKTVFSNTFWIGGGYRQDVGAILNGGVRIKQIKIGYSRELNAHKINGERMGANEVALSYNFEPTFEKGRRALSIW